MRRGEVWLTRFDEARGSEINKTRPAIIVSNDYANHMLNRVQIVPLSSRTQKLYRSEAMVTVEGRTSKAVADQIGTADKRRLLRLVGALSKEDMARVEMVLKIQLGLTS
jgi:mRNA interferase MazF